MQTDVLPDQPVRADAAFRRLSLWPWLESLPAIAPPDSQAALADDQWRVDAARVARDPLDLDCHVRRVLMHCQPQADASRLLATLVDLFLVLGPRGPELRASLLARARAYLSPDAQAFLGRHLAAGLDHGSLLPAGVPSVLAAGLVGSIGLVALQRQAESHSDSLERAVDLVDQGDTAAAQALLEDALLSAPHDQEIADELTQLYRLNNDSEAAAAMAARLRAAGQPLPAGWPAPPAVDVAAVGTSAAKAGPSASERS